jgi:hypothetical protein
VYGGDLLGKDLALFRNGVALLNQLFFGYRCGFTRLDYFSTSLISKKVKSAVILHISKIRLL